MADEVVEEGITGNLESASDLKPEQGEKVEQEVKVEKPEPTIPLSRLREETQKRKAAEKALEAKNNYKEGVDRPVVDNQQKSAEEYLKSLVEKTLTEREQTISEQNKKDLEVYNEMLDNFASFDPEFDKEQFGKLVVKYQPGSEDAAWQLWQDFKERKTPKVNDKPKPKMPDGIRAKDELSSQEKYKDDKKKTLWQVVDDAKKGIPSS